VKGLGKGRKKRSLEEVFEFSWAKADLGKAVPRFQGAGKRSAEFGGAGENSRRGKRWWDEWTTECDGGKSTRHPSPGGKERVRREYSTQAVHGFWDDRETRLIMIQPLATTFARSWPTRTSRALPNAGMTPTRLDNMALDEDCCFCEAYMYSNSGLVRPLDERYCLGSTHGTSLAKHTLILAS
jgi:hypothetical protein